MAKTYTPGYAHIHNEAAYEEATRKRIRENAKKGRASRWAEASPGAKELAARIACAAERGNPFMRSLHDAIENWGALSPKQEAAAVASFAREDARKAAAQARDASSLHVGKIGERFKSITLTVQTAILVAATDWSDAFRIIIMKDEAGNVFVYKGNSFKLEMITSGDIYEDVRPDRGDVVSLAATVKAHTIRDGVAQTILARPKLKTVTKG